MYIKILGSVFLIVGGGGLGMYYGMYSEIRRGELEQIKRALLLMYSETEFGHCLMAEMCHKAANICDEAVGEIFRLFKERLNNKSSESLAQMWEECVEQGVIKLHISKEDIAEIIGLGISLGAMDINRQLTGINNVIDYIDYKTHELSEVSKKNIRLYKNIGVMLGTFMVILLF